MKFVRFLVETFILGLAILAFQYSGWWALLIIPLLLAVGVYLDLDYFQAKERGLMTFYTFRSREKKEQEFWRTAKEAEQKLFHNNN